MHTVSTPGNYDEWRTLAIELLQKGYEPEALIWNSDQAQSTLFDAPQYSAARQESPKSSCADPIQLKVPANYLRLAKALACQRDPSKWDLMYRLLHRITIKKERGLLSRSTDKDVFAANAMHKEIRRDVHKMHAFVRFRFVERVDGREKFAAWYEPDHRIAEYTADFFVKRFHGMDWSIITPDESVHWDGRSLVIGPGGKQADAPLEDDHEFLWQGYYKSIFNPARLKLKAMQSEMPKKYWKNLPEADLIESLSREASQRTSDMLERAPTPPKGPIKNRYLKHLKALNSIKGETPVGN